MKIGIDLGSSNSLAAFVGVEGDPILVPDAADPRHESTPSRIMLQGDRVLIGYYAQKLGHENAFATQVSNFKRHFGTNQVLAMAGSASLHSEAMAALLLKKLRNDVEIYTGQPVQGCVITVPAHFHDQQRRSLISAADIADLEVIALLDEPIAAALQYGRSHPIGDDEIVVIYDIGGGTFDLTVLTCVQGQIHILAKSGLTDLGGFDFDRVVEDRFRDDFAKRFGKSVKPGALNDTRIAGLAEDSKIFLNSTEGHWPQNDIYVDGKFLRWTMDPSKYQEKSLGLLKRTEAMVLKTLRGIGLELADVSRFVPIGGASRGVLVRKFWSERLDLSRQSFADEQPLASVAMGAALYADSFVEGGAGAKFISNLKMSSVTAYNIGLLDEGSQAFERIIDKNAKLPASGSALVRTAGGARSGFAALLCQYLDNPAHLDQVGQITVQARHLHGREAIEIVLRNNDDGTLGIKVIDPRSGAVVPFEFEDLTGGGRDVEAQRAAVASLRINALDY